MDHPTEQSAKPPYFRPEFSDAIANAANYRAALEYSVNKTIWALALVPPALGSCITSQIYTLNAKLDALVALMNIRKVDPSIIRKTNQFSSTIREAQEARNRIMHDYWYQDKRENHKMGRLTITEKKILEFKIISIAIEDLRKDVEKIENKRFEFAEIEDQINLILPSLPPIPHALLHPITEIRLPRQTPSIDSQ